MTVTKTRADHIATGTDSERTGVRLVAPACQSSIVILSTVLDLAKTTYVDLRHGKQKMKVKRESMHEKRLGDIVSVMHKAVSYFEMSFALCDLDRYKVSRLLICVISSQTIMCDARWLYLTRNLYFIRRHLPFFSDVFPSLFLFKPDVLLSLTECRTVVHFDSLSRLLMDEGE